MNIFKMEQNLSLCNGVADVKVTTPEVTFDTTSDFNLAFFESSTPPPTGGLGVGGSIKKEEPEFDESVFDSVTPDSLFSPSSDYNSHSSHHFKTEDVKFSSSFSDSPSAFQDSGSNLSPASTPTVSSPLPSPGMSQSNTQNGSLKSPIIIKTEQSYQVADSTPASPATPMKSFVPCKVCGDKASGYHYGVTSCEGCKGFFRRSIQKQIEYRCLRDGKCLVIRLNRNRCQYCRFKKCIAVGMSRDSVRYGRVPKRSREREESGDSRGPVESMSVDNSVTTSDNRQLAIYDIILSISHAHHANCAYTEEKTRSLARKHIIFSSMDANSDPETATSTADALEQQKISWWQSFAVFVTPCIQRVVEFAKRVPGFVDLSQDDQLMLIKGGFFELWLTQVSRMISPLDGTLTFHDGSYITKHQLEMMFEQEFVSNMFNFSVSFNNLNLNDTEIGLFVAVVLLTAERPGVADTKSVEQFQDKVIEALRVQVGRNHQSESHMFTSLAMKLPELRQIGCRHNDHLNWFRAHWAQLKLPPLFAEIFDVPKCEEDLL